MRFPPHPLEPNPNRMQPSSSSMQSPPRPAPLAQHPNPTPVPTRDANPNPGIQPSTQTDPDQTQPNPLSSNSAHEDLGRPNSPTLDQDQQAHPLKFFSNNPLAMGDLTDFPPLLKGSTVHEIGGSGDIVMASVDEGASRSCGDRRHISSAPPIEQALARPWLLLLGPPPLSRSG